jgi:hypothetical protein
MPVRRLPSNPNLAHLKYQAKDLLRAHSARTPDAAQRLREFLPHFRQASDDVIFATKLSLADAQLAIARESGFPSWTRLKRRVEKPAPIDELTLPHHERIKDLVFRRAVDLIDSGDVAGLRAHLQKYPKLSRQQVFFEGSNYFHNPMLLQFVAENPIRRGKLPENIVDVAEVILDAGVETWAVNETLALVATGSVPYQCRVQIPLIRLLCSRGADPDTAVRIAAVLGGHEAAHELIRCGAHVNLPVASALGMTEDALRLLATAAPDERHLALSVASDFGRIEIVRMLLDAGENPDRYNPIGGHSHTTPLHQAALSGHDQVVHVLVERGARLDMQDILFHGTPADWAHHNGHTEIESYLRAETERRREST